MIRSLADYLHLAAAYVRFNLRAHLEYRGAFFSQVVSMFINDGAWQEASSTLWSLWARGTFRRSWLRWRCRSGAITRMA